MRKLSAGDFGAGKIDRFTPADFGKFWAEVAANAGYALNRFSRAVAFPLTITSTYRTPEQNKRAGGAVASRHLTGEAVDVFIDDPDFFELKRLGYYVNLAREVGFRGIGIYEGQRVLHLDVRETPAGWGKVLDPATGKRVMVSLEAALRRVATSGPTAVGVALVVFALLFLWGKRWS